jgi:uncharacterized protein YjaZ
MKKILLLMVFAVPVFGLSSFENLLAQPDNSKYIINKANGRIILAYKIFEDFLNSDKSWNNYKTIVLESFPEIRIAHEKALTWGSIDSVKFPNDVTHYKKEDWARYFTQYNPETLNFLYDSLVLKANRILKPLSHKPVDLCMFLPYGGCFIETGRERNTIFISLLIDPHDVNKIIVHEYSHNLHFQRRLDEPFNLGREIVSEGMAVYLTTLILNDHGLSKSIPFMSSASVKWCFDNEKMIKDSIRADLSDTTFTCLKKFIADGSFATPPAGFVEKTGYFAGFRVIEACLKKGMKLEDLCSLNSDTVIEESGYFN